VIAVGTRPRVLGIDVSLSSTGLALVDHRGLRTGLVRTRPVEGYAATTTRLQYIKAGVREWLTQPVDLAVLEDPTKVATSARGQMTGKASERAGLFWLVLDLLAEAGVPFGACTSSQLKQYGTGNGNAGKAAMVAAAREAFPRAGIAKDDEADAAWLAAMGARRLGAPIDGEGTTARAKALQRAEWPALLSD
jgi:crossover junction endodeoxyribonuclease RuvC